MKIYQSYLFTNKDPIIYEIWDLIKTTPFSVIERKSGVAARTLQGWFYGRTERPQLATVRAVLRAVGHDLSLCSSLRELQPPTIMGQKQPSGLVLIEGGRKVRRRPPAWGKYANNLKKRRP